MQRYSIVNEPGIRPPANARDAQAWRDLEPASPGGSTFEFPTKDGEPRRINASKHLEQVLRTLMKAPLYCGSRCRLSHYVMELRELGVDIETEGFRSEVETGRQTYGVWFLRSNIEALV